jgi:hypothetical protein
MQLLSRDKYEDRLRTRAAFHVSDTECLFGSLTGISHRTRHVHLPPRAVFQRPLATVPSIHWPSSRTRYCPFFVSQSTSSTLRPSATEQQGPLRLARLSNHCLKGEFAYFPSRSRVRAKPGKNDNDNAIEKKMPRTRRNLCSVICIIRYLMHRRSAGQIFGPRAHEIELDQGPAKFRPVISLGYSAVSKRCLLSPQ